jgi:hypothetical protein
MRRKPKTHELKCLGDFFEPVIRGEKKFELRKDDRGFAAGDTLHLREWSPRKGYSGRDAKAEVLYLVGGPLFGLRKNYVCMSIDLTQSPLWDD